ncbi:MAG: hypothetical protein ABIU63_06455 [Chitinophagaceae bacterium]
MKLFLVLIFTCTVVSVVAQDSSLLKKRGFKIVASAADNVQTRGWLANITDSAIQLSDQPVRFARTGKSLNITALNYNLLAAVRIKRQNAGWRGLRTGFICGFAFGGVIGLASGNDKSGFFPLSAGEKAIGGGLLAGLLSATVGAIIGAFPGRKFIISGKKENFDQLRISVLERAYRAR